MNESASRQIAILVYDRFTALDAIGPYEVLSPLPGYEIVFVGERRGPVRTDTGYLAVTADADLTDVATPDVVLVPGGPGQESMMGNGPVHEWLRAADRTSTWTTSVCTGSLVLGAAGLLQGHRATTHWALMTRLATLGVVTVDQRVVFDGKYVTAAGVSSGIDMALTLAGRIAGDDFAQGIQLMLEYDPRPPYDAGSIGKAAPAIVDLVRARLGRPR